MNFFSYQWGNLNQILKKKNIKSLWIHNFMKNPQYKNIKSADKYLGSINQNSKHERGAFIFKLFF